VINGEDQLSPPEGHDPHVKFEDKTYYMHDGIVAADRAALQAHAPDEYLVLASRIHDPECRQERRRIRRLPQAA